MRAQLNLAYAKYEIAILRSQSQETYDEAIPILQQGLDQAANAIKENAAQILASWEKGDVSTIDDDIRRTITS